MLPAKALAGALVVLTLTAGCVGPSPAGSGSETPTPEPPVDSATPPPDPTTTPGAEGSTTDTKVVGTRDAWNQSVEIRIRVVREATNETVHEGTYTLDPGAEREVYSVADADPDGVESFRVTATARNTTESVTIETNVCYGGAYVEVQEDGTLYPYYAIC